MATIKLRSHPNPNLNPIPAFPLKPHLNPSKLPMDRRALADMDSFSKGLCSQGKNFNSTNTKTHYYTHVLHASSSSVTS